MPFAARDGFRLHYEVDGSGTAPWLMFCNALGATASMWRPQVPALSTHFRVLRYDRRGHGRSNAPPAPYTLDDLVDDALAVMDAAGAERVHYCGLSIGGLVAQALALRRINGVRLL